MRRAAVACLLALLGCRIESAAPRGATAASEGDTPHGELWVYSSAFPSMIDEFDALAKRALPDVTIRWYKAGTEKIASRIEGEVAAGGVKADVLLVSDPFLYERYKRDGLLLRYASPNELRVPRSMLDLDASYTTVRISTMGLAYRKALETEAPKTFAELTDPKWKGKVAIGDPLSSGTALCWVAFEMASLGPEWFRKLRENGAVVAGGNAAVQSRIESGEVSVGVLLLENVLASQAAGGDLQFRYPEDGAVTIPGYIALFKNSRNPTAAKAFYDLVLSVEGQNAVVRAGRMHAPDPRHPGPVGQPDTQWLLEHSKPWSEEFIAKGTDHSSETKKTFAEAFSK